MRFLVRVPTQLKISDFIDKKEKQLPNCEPNLAAEQRLGTNGELDRGVNIVKRRRK
jgi:hypothetical protein